MSRVRIEIPGEPVFTTTLSVRVSDINYGGHLGNDRLISMFHEGRMRWLTGMGQSELDLFGAGILQTDTVAVYRSEAFFGDTLHLMIYMGEIYKKGFELFCKITNKETGQEIARGKTGFVFYDYGKKKIVNTPGEFRTRFS